MNPLTHQGMELLAPAGSEDALHAAVDCGANAVYLGFTRFGARASAVNFDEETLARAAAYAHLHHVRVYTTVNILVKPQEVDDLYRTLEAISACGADAVIIQDMGVARIVRESFPQMAMHASTQMAIGCAEQARFALSQGFSRVVLARECELPEIRRVCETGADLEVFVHGALCTAVSGRCLMSSMAGGRSGNRGRCAQPCRKTYLFDGRETPVLSQRDLCLIRDLPALRDAGVHSLKLEGRMKSPEYVAVVTSAYRKALDELENGRFDPERVSDIAALKQIFNRGGFTRGHAMLEQDADLMSGERVSHEGVVIGKVTKADRKWAEIRVSSTLHNEDSLQLRGHGSFETRYSGPEVPKGQIARIRLRPDMNIAAGMEAARLADSEQLKAARAHVPAPIPVRMHLTARIGEPMQLNVIDGICEVTVPGSETQAAQTRGTDVETIRRQLGKLGGTPFTAVPEDIRIDADENVFVAVSALNELRRAAAEQLAERRTQAFYEARQTCKVPADASFERMKAAVAEGPAVIFRDAGMADALRSAGTQTLIYDPPVFTAESLRKLPNDVWLRLPPQVRQDEVNSILPVIMAQKDKLIGLWAESIGWLRLPIDLPMIAGEGVPVCNEQALRCVEEQGVSGWCLWTEWNENEQKALLPARLPVFRKVYGRETLMLLNHCPKRVALGLHTDRAQCSICENSEVCGQRRASITDTLGHVFPLMRTRFDAGCEISVLNDLPTDLLRSEGCLVPSVLPLIRLTDESEAEAIEIVRATVQVMRSGLPVLLPYPSTSGYWQRGVE